MKKIFLTDEEIEAFNRGLEKLSMKPENRDLLICGMIDDEVKDGDSKNYNGFNLFLKKLKKSKIDFTHKHIPMIVNYCLSEKFFILPIYVMSELGELAISEKDWNKKYPEDN
jgi:hypothetical protein